jgi:hypothetical protein
MGVYFQQKTLIFILSVFKDKEVDCAEVDWIELAQNKIYIPEN